MDWEKNGIADFVRWTLYRAHPGAPNQPPYETLAGFLLMPIDKLKDMFTAFPTQEDKEAAKNS